MLTYPSCKATHIVKYGKTRTGTQNYKCRECGRRFVEQPNKKYISQEGNAKEAVICCGEQA